MNAPRKYTAEELRAVDADITAFVDRARAVFGSARITYFNARGVEVGKPTAGMVEWRAYDPAAFRNPISTVRSRA